MLFLVAIGAGAAVLEVHRALQHYGNSDISSLREKEAELRKQLQDMQRELRTAEQSRQLTEAEAAQLAAVNQRLAAEVSDLAAASSSLRAENEALAARADSLQGQQAALESAAETLRLENCTLLQQFDRLKLKYEQEAAGFKEQVAELKAAVSGTLGRFTSGDISADQLIAYLSAMGVELRCRKEALESLPEQLTSARSREERLKLLDRVDVEVQDGWMQQMRLITAEPDVAARLLRSGAMTARRAVGAAAPALPQLPEAQSAVASSAPLALPQQPAKLPTPPKERQAAQLPSVKVPPLKLAALTAAHSGSGSSNIAAVASDLPIAGNENAGAAANAVLMPIEGGAEGGARKKASGSMRFVPVKKLSKKQAVSATTSQLALDLPLSSRGEGSALPRLPFDAGHDDLDPPGGKGLMSV